MNSSCSLIELRVIDEEEVNLYMVNPKAPCFIKDDEGKFIYLILPVEELRIKAYHNIFSVFVYIDVLIHGTDK